jgi:hypothetical protein
MHIMAHMQYLTNESAAVMAQSDQAALGEQMDPGVTAALQAGVGLPLPPNGLQQEQEMMDEEMMGEEMMEPEMGDEAMLMSENPNLFGGM